MRLRNVLIATTTLVAGTIVGATTQHFASADVSSGDRPVLVPIETCRLADTRPAPDTVGPKSSQLAAADTMSVSAQQAGTDCTGKIPAGATALSLNVTALNATSNSFITIWPEGPRPTASALNPAPGQRVFNAVTTELAADQTFQIYNNRGDVDVFVDVNGYYEHHNHDDLYYTESETTQQLAELTGDNIVDDTLTLADLGGGGDGTRTVSSDLLVPGGECRSAGGGNSGASQIGKMVLFTIADAVGNPVIPNGATAVPSVVIGTSQGGAIIQFLICNGRTGAFTIPSGSIITYRLIAA